MHPDPTAFLRRLAGNSSVFPGGMATSTRTSAGKAATATTMPLVLCGLEGWIGLALMIPGPEGGGLLVGSGCTR